MFDLDFRTPLWLLLLIPWAGALYVYYGKRIYQRGAAVAVSASPSGGGAGFRVRTYPLPGMLRFAAALLLIIAAAAPGRGIVTHSLKTSGIDIMISLDLSSSMMAEDFKPSRLEAAKRVAGDFISRRGNDRIGMVIFAGEAYLQCPLTLEHGLLLDILHELDFNSVKADGTAIGDAIALSSARIVESDAESQIILLITDGVNNRGVVDPATASGAAAALGIKIYTVGIGTDEIVTIRTPQGAVRLRDHYDEESLKKIAQKTGGNFFGADSKEKLEMVLAEIDRLEKSEIEAEKYTQFTETSLPLVTIALLLFIAEIAAKSLYYRKVP